MKTLMIKDLSANVELDSKAMAAVAGGLHPFWGAPSLSFSRTDIDTKTVIASQGLEQAMNLGTNTGINAAFVSDLTSNVRTYQSGENNITIV